LRVFRDAQSFFLRTAFLGLLRWNTRKQDDGARIVRSIKQADGKRLQYRESVDNPPYLPKPKGQMNAPFQNEDRQ
jgi:hypothetical protein